MGPTNPKEGKTAGKTEATGATNDNNNDNSNDSSIFYFGFGAMTNPVSRKRRGVDTVSCQAAILPDYVLSLTDAGVATVHAAKGHKTDCVHGILMAFSNPAHWKIIQDFERGYDVIVGDVYPYNGGGDYCKSDNDNDSKAVKAHFFQLPAEEPQPLPKIKLPQERYLKIISMGLRHHGVDEDYIRKHILAVDCIPSRQRDAYHTFPNAAAETAAVAGSESSDLARWTWQDYQAHKDTCFLIGTRAMEVQGEAFLLVDNADHPFLKWVKLHLLGQPSCTWTIYQALYEPDLPECESPADLIDWHDEWAEDQLVDQCGNGAPEGVHVRAVALLQQSE